MKKAAFLILFALFVLSAKSYCQAITIGPGVGIMLFEDEPVSYVSEVSGTDYFNYENEFFFGLKAKFHIPYTPLRIITEGYYGFLTDEFTNPGTTTRYKATGSLLNIGAGAEFIIIPGPISPYISVDGFLSSFGDVEVKRLGDREVKEREVQGNARFGLGFGAGAEIFLLPNLDADLSFKYAINNLIGKEQGESNINSINLSLNLYYQIF